MVAPHGTGGRRSIKALKVLVTGYAISRMTNRQPSQRRGDFFCYVQWIAHQQWRDIKAHAEQRGVALMGDIPFGVSYYSADVFSRRE